MIPKKLIDRTAALSPECFGLCPFMLDRIKIGRINRQVLDQMPGRCYSFPNVPTFMESGVVHNDDAVFRKFRQ